MPDILNIITRPDDLANEVIEREQQEESLRVETVDLTVKHPDYEALLEKVFEARAVHIW